MAIKTTTTHKNESATPRRYHPFGIFVWRGVEPLWALASISFLAPEGRQQRLKYSRRRGLRVDTVFAVDAIEDVNWIYCGNPNIVFYALGGGIRICPRLPGAVDQGLARLVLVYSQRDCRIMVARDLRPAVVWKDSNRVSLSSPWCNPTFYLA